PLLTRKGAEKRLIARRRAEQVQTGCTWVIGGKAVVSCANGTSMAICRLLNHRKQAGKNGRNGKQVGEWTTYDQNGNVYKLTQMAKKGTKSCKKSHRISGLTKKRKRLPSFTRLYCRIHKRRI